MLTHGGSVAAPCSLRKLTCGLRACERVAALMPLLGAAIIGVVRGKWFVLSASVTLLALVAVAVTMLSRVSANKTKPAAQGVQASPPLEVHLSGKIRAQSVVSVAPPVEGTVGAVFADVGQEVFEGQLLARITNEG